MMTIHSDNSIFIDGKNTGLRVAQARYGTVVYSTDGTNYLEHLMPHARYSLAHDAPASGAAGRAQFEKDILAMDEEIL
jgi:hypothetical protein